VITIFAMEMVKREGKMMMSTLRRHVPESSYQPRFLRQVSHHA
jgi:hypothetical protein